MRHPKKVSSVYNEHGLVKTSDETIYHNDGRGVRRVEIVDGKVCGVKRHVSKKQRIRERRELLDDNTR
jgi:hypothetical protein